MEKDFEKFKQLLLEKNLADYYSSSQEFTIAQVVRNLLFEGQIDILEIPQEIRVNHMFIYKSVIRRALHLPCKQLYESIKIVIEQDLAVSPDNTELKILYQERILQQLWEP